MEWSSEASKPSLLYESCSCNKILPAATSAAFEAESEALASTSVRAIVPLLLSLTRMC